MQGNLTNDHLPEIIRSLNHDRESGVLSLSRESVSKEIIFGQGAMVFASSNYRDDRLGEFLVRNGKMTRTHLELATQRVEESGLRLGSIMVAMGLMTETEMLARVDDQLRNIIYSVFPWDQGEYRFQTKNEPVASELARDLPTYPIILEGARRVQDPLIIHRAFGSLDRIIGYAKDPSSLCGEIHLSSEESYVLSRVDGHSSVENIIAVSPFEENQTLRYLYGLLSIGVLELGKKTREIEPSKSKIQVPPSGTKARFSPSKDELTSGDEFSPEERWIREDIKAKSSSLGRGTYYDWLEVSRTANDVEIKKSYYSQIKTYHPDRLYSKNLSDLKNTVEEIITKITNAHDVLSDPIARRRYDNSLRTEAPRGEDLTPRQEPTETPKKTTPKDAQKNTAEQHYKQAKKHFAEGEYHLTAEMLDVCLRLDPSNPSYHKLQGRALAKNPNWTKDAEEHFLNVLENDPSDIECLVGLGDLYEAAGLARKAERMYFRALGLDPANEELKERLLAKKQPPKWMSWLKILQH
jgi:curved DNA-binding protein CbpA